MPWTEEDFEKLKRRLIEERNKWRREKMKRLLITGMFLLPALFKYVEIPTLVDVATTCISGLLLIVCVYALSLIGLIKEGYALDIRMYNSLKEKKSLHSKLFLWIVQIPNVLAGLVYAEATITIVIFIVTNILSRGLKSHFNSFEWSDKGYCLSKLKEEK